MSAPTQPPAANASGTPSSASLYVGDLASDVTEALLFEIFNAVGPVASIRVCRDAVTRRSLGYAYVNFHNVMDAERALDTMNFINIRGKPCRIMWSQRDPSLRKSGVGNVFVKNLDKTIDHKTLYDTFSMFGNILSCKVATDDEGESRGYGFVHYTNPESASKAIQKVNGMVIAEKKVTVAQFIPKEQRQQGVRKFNGLFTNIYVCGFPESWTGDTVKAEFESAGTVNSVHVATSEKGLPFGFANFPNHEDAARAVELFNGKQIDEQHKLYVARAMKKMERAKFLSEKFEKMKSEYQKKFAGVNLYVKYLDDSIDDPRLRKEFEKFGTITSAKVMRDANGRSRGFGFVCFEQPEQSTRAMAEMNSKLVEGKPLYVALAQRKEVRKANLEKETVERRGQKPAFGGPQNRGRNFNQGPRGPKGPFNPQGPKFNNPMYYQQGRMNPQMMFPQAQNMMMQRGYPGMNPQMRGYPRQMNMPMQNFGMPPPNQMQRPGPGRPMMPPQARPGPGPQMQQPAQPPQPTQPKPMPVAFNPKPARPDHSQPLTSEMLSAANPSQQKQMIGERIFPRIQSREPKLAGKITGMLLEMDNMELLHLLDDENALMAKINEALAVLNQHQVNNEEPMVAGAE